MKKKYLFLLPALTCAMQSSSLAQDTHPDLKLSASKIDTSAEYVQLNRLSGDLSAITQYLELVLDAARKSGEDVPPNLKAKDLMEILGINTIKATGLSCTKVDNAWVNRSFLDNGGSDAGVFSLLGGKNLTPVVPTIAPAGTDVALQLQLDLRQTEKLAVALAKAVGEGDKIDENMSKKIPELGMTTSEVLSKLDVRVNFMMDLDAADQIPTPFGMIGRPFMAARIDGIAWLWDKIGKKALAESGAPFDVVEKDGLVILKLNEEGHREMVEGDGRQVAAIMKLSPIVIIDPASNHVWLASNEDFLKKCMSGKNTLAESSAYKAAMEGLPTSANSMAYVSKDLLKHIAEKYQGFAQTGMMGADFEKAKPLVDRFMEDITESDKGWAIVLTKDDNGVATSTRGPFAAKHLKYLSGLVPYFTMAINKSNEAKFERRMRALDASE